MKFGVGQTVERKEDQRFLTGTGRYLDDIKLDNQAQAYFLRGDAYLGLSQWNEAIADFQQYLTMRPGLIDSYV